jgi:hypothetical protein
LQRLCTGLTAYERRATQGLDSVVIWNVVRQGLATAALAVLCRALLLRRVRREAA